MPKTCVAGLWHFLSPNSQSGKTAYTSGVAVYEKAVCGNSFRRPPRADMALSVEAIGENDPRFYANDAPTAISASLYGLR